MEAGEVRIFVRWLLCTRKMTLSINNIVCAAKDSHSLATWWCEQFRGELQAYSEDFVVVHLPNSPLEMWFQPQNPQTPGKNRIHLDLKVDDMKPATAELIKAGAKLVAEHVEPTFSWTVLEDPEGNQFCIS